MGKRGKKKSAEAANKGFSTTSVNEEDSRFDTKLSQPQFRQPKQKNQHHTTSTKVILDERFASALTDPRFQLDVQDKYGRRPRKEGKDKVAKELSEFYTVIEKQDDESGDVNRRPQKGEGSKTDDPRMNQSVHQQEALDNKRKTDDPSEDEESEREEVNNPSSRIAYLTALSRGQLDVSSSSSDEDDDSQSDSSKVDNHLEDESDHDEDDDMVDEEIPGVLDPSFKEKEAPIQITTEATPFLAVLNMEWSHVRAVDIFALLTSFSPPGSVKRVRVFLSDLGKEKLAEEERIGPSDIWKEKGKTGEHGGVLEENGDDSDVANPETHDGSDSADEDDSNEEEDPLDNEELLPEADHVDSGFDPEKLRAYEATKLKYYFAIAEFSSPACADMAYREVDGLEFEHSSAAVDLRAIQPSEMEDVIKDRTVRDEASSLPSNYVPPDFVVGALQQTRLQCTWEIGDQDRERNLTKYTSGAAWQSLAESDDLKAYLASDASSDEEAGSDTEKTSNMRRLLGLDIDQEDHDSEKGGAHAADVPSSSDSESGSSSESDDSSEKMSKEVTFLPGQKKESLESKIRSKLEMSADTQELTPWQKYQQKRKEKRKERRQAATVKRQAAKEGSSQQPHGNDEGETYGEAAGSSSKKQSLEELELLLAGDDQDEEARDYDMRELQRLEKNKDKKLRGSRKKKESERAAAASGADFELNMQDERFKAVLEGDDDRFGIDRTDPNYKETPAMKEILAEQGRRRKSKKRKMNSKNVAPNVSADGFRSNASSGEAALSAMVTRIKSKVKS